MLAATALGIARLRSLFATVMLTGIYSLLGASWMLALDAPDVAFTEAAVGAGISTVLMLGTLALTAHVDRPTGSRRLLPFFVVLATGAALVYGTVDMPAVGDPRAPATTSDVTRYYLVQAPNEVAVPNIVTAILASYRGYDTLGETTVILTAGIGVLLLLRRSKEDDVEPRAEGADAQGDRASTRPRTDEPARGEAAR